jgi:hypothetical protein
VHKQLLNIAIATAVAQAAVPQSVLQLNDAPRSLCVQANFTYGSGGTTVGAILQTSLDGGTTWCDVASFAFTTASAIYVFNVSSLTPVTTEYTPSNGTLAGNTCKDGVLGPMFRVLLATTGTYAGATKLTLDVNAQER